MKTLLKTFAILFISLLIFSCSNDDDNTTTPTPTTSTSFIRCKIDGVAYEAPVADILADQNEIAWNFRSDISGGASNIGLDFSITGQAAVGTYTFNTTNVMTVGRLNYRSPDIYSSGICTGSNGTLTITAKNGKTIEGTFSFTGKKIAGCTSAAKVITDGTFRVTFL
jgi:Family of unknown function (DUF6252)